MGKNKLLNYRDVTYEVYGRWKTPKMIYDLSVTEGFSDLGDARHCAAMLKRGGCEVKLHRVKLIREKEYKSIHV